MDAQETFYKGYKFRSRLEARWAVFFDECGVWWEYEPERFDLPENVSYLPDFLLHNVAGKAGWKDGNLWVEVKGTAGSSFSGEDETRIDLFSGTGDSLFFYPGGTGQEWREYRTPLLMVSSLPFLRKPTYDWEDHPRRRGIKQLERHAEQEKRKNCMCFSFYTINGLEVLAYPGINTSGRFEVFGPGMGYLEVCEEKTYEAYRVANSYSFEEDDK